MARLYSIPPAGGPHTRLQRDGLAGDLAADLLNYQQLWSGPRCSKRRRVLEVIAPASRAQPMTETSCILDGQGRKIPFPAVEWPTNSKTYAAFAKSQKATSAPFKLTMGLEPLGREDWIEVEPALQYLWRSKGSI